MVDIKFITHTPEIIRTVTPLTTVKSVENSFRNTSLSEILDNSILDCINAGAMNLAAKKRFRKILDKAMPMIMTPENFINKGRESKVYRISDNFVAKVKRGKAPDNLIHFYNTLGRPSQGFNKLSSYYGEPLIRIGNVEILKNATPTQNFVSCGAKLNHNLKVDSKSIKQYESEFVPLCASLPQESYDAFAADLVQLNTYSSLSYNNLLKPKNYIRLFGMKPSKMPVQKYHYTPDIVNPNNIIIADGKFKIVDKLEQVPVKEPNTLYTMLNPLLIKMGPENEAIYNSELIAQRVMILKKSLRAAEKVSLPLNTKLKEEFTDWNLRNILPISSCGFDYMTVIKNLTEMRNNSSLAERLQYIDKSINI